MIRRALPLIVALLVAPALVRAAADAVKVTPLARDGRLYVSFSLEEGLTPEIYDAIRSGLETTYTYDLELRRGTAVWFDRTIASAVVTATVHYDNLTRRHQLSRAIDGRVDAALVTENDEDVQRWMTTFTRLPLFVTRDLEPNAEYYVRVRARPRPRSSWSLWPWGGGLLGVAKFTFIP